MVGGPCKKLGKDVKQRFNREKQGHVESIYATYAC